MSKRQARKLAQKQARAAAAAQPQPLAPAAVPAVASPEPPPPVVPSETGNPLGGPRTEQGKAISSQNAFQHGCCSVRTIFRNAQDREAYDALATAWFEALAPTSAHERNLVQSCIDCDFLSRRATQIYFEVESALQAQAPASPWSEADQKKLGLFARYRTTNANLLAKARRELEMFRRARLAETRAQEKLALQRQRVAQQAEKHAMALQKHLAKTQKPAAAPQPVSVAPASVSTPPPAQEAC
jgi:hypothetical protein